jgi:tetratricopeptide (TPR) repeat protein
VNSVTALAPLDECRKVERLLLQEQPSPRDAASVERVRGLLADARVLRNTGRREPSDALLRTALTEARRLQFAPLLAEALLQHGRASAMDGQTEQATQNLQEAVRSASRGRHDHAAAEALLDLLFLEGVVKHRDAALELRLPAVAALDRLGGDGALEARLASTTGLILARHGDWTEALEEQQRALRLMEQVYGREAVQVGSQLHKVAEMLEELGRPDDAEAHARRALTILERTYGAGHPMLALPLSVLAESSCGRGQYAECLAQAEAALAIRATAATPPTHPAFLPKHLLIARALAGLGRHSEALERLKSAEQMARAALPEGDAWRGRVDLTACEVLRRAGQREQALARCRQGLEVLRRALGEGHPEVAAARRSLEVAASGSQCATEPLPRALPPSSSAP